MNRVKAIFRAAGSPVAAYPFISPKIVRSGWKSLRTREAQLRAKRLLEQLQSLEPLCVAAQKDLVREGRKHQSYKILRRTPGLGPIRVALILAFVMTPHRFRNKRQFWTYAGFSVVRRGSAEYEITQGELKRTKRRPLPRGLNPHFSQAFYCGGADGHVYCVALRRAPRRTVKYVCGALGRAPCIHARLRLLATKPREKCGLRNYNHVLKNVFKGAATTVAYRGAFKPWFDQRVANVTAPNHALLTLARKIASITLALWKKGERFDIERHRLSEQTT